MLYGEITIKKLTDSQITVNVDQIGSKVTVKIPKNASIVALCDSGFFENGSIPTVTRYSFEEIMDNIVEIDDNEYMFDDDLRYICGISVL